VAQQEGGAAAQPAAAAEVQAKGSKYKLRARRTPPKQRAQGV